MMHTLKKMILCFLLLLFVFALGRWSNEFESVNQLLGGIWGADKDAAPIEPVAEINLHTLKMTRDNVYGGLPKGRKYTKLHNVGHTVGYSKTLKNPLWVSYRLNVDRSDTKDVELIDEYQVDVRTFVSVTQEDIEESGYQLSAMAPSLSVLTRYGEQAYLATFLTSNVCPQQRSLQQGQWKDLEEKVVLEYLPMAGAVWVVAGPIFDNHNNTLKSGVEVPDKFYKIVLDEQGNQIKTLAFIFDQNVAGDEDLNLFLTTIDDIEERTGLDFFWELPDSIENDLEAKKSPKIW